MEEYMNIALKQAKKAFNNNEVPIGAIVVRKGKIIAKAFNQKEKKQSPTAHAEIIAIEKAAKKLKSWRLDDCELFVTIEPCMMCMGAIVQSRLKKVIYGAKNEKFGFTDDFNIKKGNHTPEIIGGIKKKEALKLMKLFFETKREK